MSVFSIKMNNMMLILILAASLDIVVEGSSLQKFKLSPAEGLQPGYSDKREFDFGTKNRVSPYWDDFEGQPSQLNVKNFNPKDLLVQPPCPVFKEMCTKNEHYRRIDGFCNNKKIPTLGFSTDTLSRLLPPIYDYGIMKMKSANGLLPSPRIVSNSMKTMMKRTQVTDNNILWLFFGQLVDHDLIFTPTALEGKEMSICDDCNSWQTHSVCSPILVPKNDKSIPPFFPNGERKCIPFIRSAAIPSKYQNSQALEQINFNTAFLDLSTVYGSNRCTERKIRLFHYGQLIEQKHPLDFNGMLPTIPIPPLVDCRSFTGRCPIAGDPRAVENIGILVFHVLFLREHNRLARKLREINKHWNDERLFQEARRINIAQYQNIIYQEFLPLMLGDKLMKMYDLYPSSKRSYFNGYDPSVSPQTLTEFATAAYRVGHTMLPDHIIEMDEYYLPKGSIPMEDVFNNATLIYKENLLEHLARGMIASRTESVDPIIQSTFTDKLFIKEKNIFTSQDLISLNIARGRDHGIPGYTAYRQLCGLSPVHDWEDLKIFKKDLDVLSQIYSSVHDIDLFAGGLCEIPNEGSTVGPTFACIIAQQFLRSKTGDHFWFENKHNHLTLDQIQAIKEGSAIRRIITFNLKFPMYLPHRIFNIPDKRRNSLESYKLVKDINFNLWRESETKERQQFCHFKGENYRPYQTILISPCLDCICDISSYEISCEWKRDNCRAYGDDEYCRIGCDI